VRLPVHPPSLVRYSKYDVRPIFRRITKHPFGNSIIVGSFIKMFKIAIQAATFSFNRIRYLRIDSLTSPRYLSGLFLTHVRKRSKPAIRIRSRCAATCSGVRLFLGKYCRGRFVGACGGIKAPRWIAAATICLASPELISSRPEVRPISLL
jgi:hypothetical protein